MKHQKRVLFLAFTLLLASCSTPDKEAMRTGLGKEGLTDKQATCYMDKLEPAISAAAYNNIAQDLNGGEVLIIAISKTRRTYGEDFTKGYKEVRSELRKCIE